MGKKDYSLDKTPANKQRLLEYKQDEKWVDEFLRRSRIGHITTCWDEQPFITPSTFLYGGEKRKIYFHSNRAGRIRANIEHHSEVCFETSEYGRFLPSNIALVFCMQYESAFVFGEIEIVENEDKKTSLI